MKNLGTLDRVIRLVIAIILALLYFTSIPSVLKIIFIVIAVILLLTSIFGYCPLYALLRISTARKEETSKVRAVKKVKR
ncbi:MAG: DUF2892 domain-containing protein [Candidatus Pacearchaeota archaeon]